MGAQSHIQPPISKSLILANRVEHPNCSYSGHYVSIITGHLAVLLCHYRVLQ